MLTAMTRFGVSLQVANGIMVELELYRQAQNRAACVKARRADYLRGGLSPDAARAALTSLGLDPLEVSDTVDAWACESSHRPKAIPAAKLCQWRAEGLISSADMLSRLITLGYSPADARAIQGDCDRKSAQAGSAAAQKAAALRARQAAQAARKAAQTKEAGARVAARRVRLITKLVRAAGMPEPEAAASVTGAETELIASGRYTPGQALAVLEGAYQLTVGKGGLTWPEALRTAVEAALR
jgi:hypothetical protein